MATPAYIKLFLDCVEPFQEKDPSFSVKLSVVAQDRIGREYRNFAHCRVFTKPPEICISPRFFRQPVHRQRALFLHELAHAWLIQKGKLDHSEQDADNTAEELSGYRIYYDQQDVQTTKPGRYPRPLYLPQ